MAEGRSVSEIFKVGLWLILGIVTPQQTDVKTDIPWNIFSLYLVHCWKYQKIDLHISECVQELDCKSIGGESLF